MYPGRHGFEVDVWSIGHMMGPLASAVTDPGLSSRISACSTRIKTEYESTVMQTVKIWFVQASS